MGESAVTVLTGLSVVVAARANNPTIINADFLRVNKICSKQMTVKDPPLTIPVFSQVSYTNGITVKADPDRVTFEQFADSVDPDDVQTPDMAAGYIAVVPHVTYVAVGINPVCVRTNSESAQQEVANVLKQKGNWAEHRECRPVVELKAMYAIEEQQVTLNVTNVIRKGVDQAPNGLIFQGNIHRDLPADMSVQERNVQLAKIIGGWRNDLNLFFELVEKFSAKRFL